jgi:hypothetical protein
MCVCATCSHVAHTASFVLGHALAVDGGYVVP